MYIYENLSINIHTYMYVCIYTYIHIHTYMRIYKYMSSMPRMQYTKHRKNKIFSNVSSAVIVYNKSITRAFFGDFLKSQLYSPCMLRID